MPRRKLTGISSSLYLSEQDNFDTDTGYSRSNSTKSPTSGAGNINEPRMMSRVGRVHEVVCI